MFFFFFFFFQFRLSPGKINEKIFKNADTQIDRNTDARMDKHAFVGPLSQKLEVQKTPSYLIQNK